MLILPLIFCLTTSAASKATTVEPGLPDKALHFGEKMYREGLLPSGEAMQAYVNGDTPAPGTSFTCISCHLRSGLGSIEGGINTPPTTGKYLFEKPEPINLTKYRHFDPSRPVYTDASFAAMLRGGVDPAGRVLNYVMPRYHLHDDDMAILIRYLKRLSSTFSPGVTEQELHLATVITEPGNAEAEFYYRALQTLIAQKNNMVKSFGKEPRKTRMAEAMLMSREAAFKRIVVKKWVLTGPPDTWRAQLEQHYRKEPVFALIGGFSAGSWQPVHQFSEEHQIPCLLPVTDFPVISDNDWYTLYFSKGLFQEGAAAARYLLRETDGHDRGAVIQIVDDTVSAKALRDGFNSVWDNGGATAARTILLTPGTSLQVIFQQNKGATFVCWTGNHALAKLSEALLAGYGLRHIASYGYLGSTIYSLPPKARSSLFITYPYRLPHQEKNYDAYVNSVSSVLHPSTPQQVRLLKQAYAVYQVLSQALIDLKGSYYRDALLDVIGMNMAPGMGMGLVLDTTFPLYERFSFGPGQRYASKGCYIVQLTDEKNPGLINRSDWVIH